MELRPGYKQTEVGVIPEAWDVMALENFIALRRGHDLTWRDRKEGEVPVMGSAGQNGFHSIAISKGPGVVLGRSGASFGQAHYCEQDFWPHNTALYVTDFHGNDRLFVFYFLRSIDFSRHNSGGAQQSLNRNFIAPIKVGVPRPLEQRAIATALSDMDALLGGLDRLIAKKRDLKQAAMQHLLTGQTRLPGFHGEWEVKKIGDLASCTAGGTPSTRVASYWGGSIRWMSSGELNLKRVAEVEGRITEAGLHNSSTTLLPAKCVLIGLAGQGKTRGTVAMNFARLCTNQSIAAVLPNPAFVPEYLYYNLDARYEELREMSTGAGGRGGLNLTIIKAVDVPFPTFAEQTTIAAVLSDMDAELSAVEARREKTRALKQAMMQELLTGKTRLVEPQVSDHQAESASSNVKQRNWAINDAVVISMLVKHFGKDDYPLGRKRCTKLSYLLHRHVDRQAEGYLKKAAGPYNPKTKYGGPEKIAMENGYIQKHKGPKGHSGFIAAENIAQAEGYFEKWYGTEAIQWLEQFRFKKNDDLEVLATVDMAMEELRASGKDVDVAAVKGVISSHPMWEAKLDRAAFSDANIADAIDQSDALMCGEIAGDCNA